jgi:hypothetical protein
MSKNKIYISIFLLWLVTISGIIGIYIGKSDWFLPKTPLNLLLGAIILFWNFPPKNGLKSVLLWSLTFLIGMLMEVIGVKYGWIFGGYYTYGANFGPKIVGVPWTIGVNWVLLTFSTGHLARSCHKLWLQFFEFNFDLTHSPNPTDPSPLRQPPRPPKWGSTLSSNLRFCSKITRNVLPHFGGRGEWHKKKLHFFSTDRLSPFEGWGANIFAATLMVGLDFFIEPLAPRFDFWAFEQGFAPLQNFVAWFLIALGLQFLIKNEIPEDKNPVPLHHFLSQLIFFAFFYVCYCI